MGELRIFTIGEDSYTSVKGDFSKDGSPMYFCFDADQRLVDIGDYNNGNYDTYLDNYNVTSMSYIPEYDKKTTEEYYDFSVGDYAKVTQRGEYFGETDENNLPCGNGYLRLYNTYTWSKGSCEQVVQYLGKWENGECRGKVLWL